VVILAKRDFSYEPVEDARIISSMVSDENLPLVVVYNPQRINYFSILLSVAGGILLAGFVLFSILLLLVVFFAGSFFGSLSDLPRG
jgi:hypothetical protein